MLRGARDVDEAIRRGLWTTRRNSTSTILAAMQAIPRDLYEASGRKPHASNTRGAA